MSPKNEADEWIFDTVKPLTVAPARNTARRRKTARIPSNGTDSCASMMQRMDLGSAPLGNVTDSPLPERRRVSKSSTTGTVNHIPAGSTPTARRVSNIQKQPLGVDLTFGNSPSTVRHFKRVPSAERRAALSSNPPPSHNGFLPNPQAKTFRPSPPNSAHPLDIDANNENEPPVPEHQQYPPMAVTKDALYGRRAYSKALDSVFQEAYADSASPHQREALGRVHQAWAHLDQVDPAGEFMLLKAMVDRVQGDPKLASALGIAVSPAPTPKLHTKSSRASLAGSTIHGTSTTRIRASTTSTTTSSFVKTTSETSTPTQASYHTPTSTPGSTSNGSPLKGPKLVLAQNNPHLKSHRRRQSAIIGNEKSFSADPFGGIDEKKLPGHVEPGMEQQGVLTNILYSQWMQGLRSRWPIT
jgi:serine/threonine-protein kinase 24/25/MST4